MKETLNTDPKQGFVALPASLFDLDLSPGAFRALAELCRMANREGQCWPSLRQLGERLGRSRAAVSGYIAELREAELIETETQRMANGYNYRLRYRVTFWKDWRGQLGRQDERRVQPVERPLETQNHSHENHQSPRDLTSDWAKAVGRAPYPEFATWPSEDLLEKTRQRLTEVPRKQIISADIIRGFTDFLRKNRIPTDTPEARAACNAIAAKITTPERMEDLLRALETLWQPHWARPPAPQQLGKLIATLPPDRSWEAQQKLLKSYLKRWEILLSRLPSAASRGKVAA